MATFRRVVCETLEDRQYLTVLHEGDTFTFRAPNTNLDTIYVTGNPGSTTLEIIGGRWNDETGAFTLDNIPGDLDGVPIGGTVNGSGTGPGTGPGIQPIQGTLPPAPSGTNPTFATRPPYFYDTVFAVYVSKSDSSTSISFVEHDLNTGAALDFSGTIGVLRETARGTVPAPANTGQMLLGGRTQPIVAATNNTGVIPPVPPPLDIPITTGIMPPNTFTLLPQGGPMTAGITVTPGNDFGNFLFGGTTLGTVSFGGSVGTLYSGWMLYDNVSVTGNAQSIISKGSIGTDNASLEPPNLLSSGFNLQVGGRLGEVRTTGDFLGSAGVTGSSSITAPAATVTEVEARSSDNPAADMLPEWELGDDPVSFNDTFNTPEILPVSATGTASVDGSLTVGPTVKDGVDYYGIALMAGQTVTVQLQSIPQLPIQPLDVGVFDPDGVEVATDYNLADMNFTQQMPFQYTATKAGLYRFAVAEEGDGTFANQPTILSQFFYNLTVSNIGNVSFGGVLADGIVRDISPTLIGFSATNGDIGAVMAIGGIFESQDLDTFVVSNGNLRAAQGTSLGDGVGARSIVVAIPAGSIGLMSATGATNSPLTVLTDPTVPIGGNVQIISTAPDASNTALISINADGSLGVLRAGNMATNVPSVINVNFLDNPNTPATIDLIDTTGDLGTLNAGGPQITTGVGGNVRYMHVGGIAHRDIFFGGGTPEETLFQPGESTQIVDDSGSVVNITPNQAVTDPNTGTVTTPAGQLTVTTYGIRGSGGSAIVNITSTGSVTITSSGNSPNQTAEIGEIDAQGTGTAVIAGTPTTTVTTPSGGSSGGGANGGNGTGTGQGGSTSIGGQGNTTVTGFPAPGTPGGAPIKTTVAGAGGNNQLVTIPPAPILDTTPGGSSLDLILNGTRTDVFMVNGTNFNSIQNQTTGELVNATASSIGNLSSAGSIGLTTGTLGEQVNGEEMFNNTYPFNQQHYGISVDPAGTGGIVSISAPRFGNIMTGSLGIGSVSGYNAGAVVTTGQINKETLTGMSWGGSGAVAQSGLFATLAVGPATSSGDVRGNLVSQTGVLGLSVGNNASIIDANIAVTGTFNTVEAFNGNAANVGLATPITKPVHDIGNISVTGKGGIMGAWILGGHIQNVTSGGFGIFDSRINLYGDGTLDTVQGAGYGIRFGGIKGGATVGAVTAIGNGSNIPITNFPTNVRQSEGGGQFDPNTGLIFSPLNDLDVTLGVTVTQPQSQNVTDSGIIEDYQILGSRNVNSISAYAIRSRDLIVGTVTLTTDIIGSLFNIANQIGTLQTAGGIDGLVLTTGRVNKFVTNGDTANFTGQFAGAINNLVFNSNLDANSVIQATGPNGHIGNLIVKGNLAGSVFSRTFINNITVYGSITGTITANRVGTVHVRGGLANGGLIVNGPINQLIFDGNGGNPGDTITINGNSRLVKVGGNLAASLNVTGNLTQLLVGGSILSGSNSVVTGTINLLKVAADIQAGASVTAKLIKRQIIGGAIDGSLITTG